MRLIENGFLDTESVDGLAEFLGIGSRHLLRLFANHVGASPSMQAAAKSQDQPCG